jgi:simple sugar transport system permease protein
MDPFNQRVIEVVVSYIRLWRVLSVPFAAVLLAAIIGAGILLADGTNPLRAYEALFVGSFGSLTAVGRTLEKATPLLFSGLAIAFGFKAGLFNIGAQGQLLCGALTAAAVGFGIQGLPAFIHILSALLAGATAGGLYAAIQGGLKVYTGAHEVITGIMLNYAAINMTDYLAAGPLRDPTPGNIVARTPLILDTSRIPIVSGIPLGFGIAVLVAVVIWWLFSRTTIGFEIRTAGLNANAASYAGMSVSRILLFTMGFSGVLAGLGGAVETQGVMYRYQPGFNVGLGFDGITVALLGRTHPFGVLAAALLVGAMKSGANQMQFAAGVAKEIIDVILALILFFVAADILVRRMIRSRIGGKKLTLTTAWGKQ